MSGSEARPTQVVMLVLNDVTHDSRVRKEARSLAQAGLDVLVVGVQPHDGICPDQESLDGFRIQRARYFSPPVWFQWLPLGLGRLLRHAVQYVQVMLAVRRLQADVYHAHDFRELTLLGPVALRRGGKLVYDSHELFFEREPTTIMRFRARLGRPFLRRLERRLARRADAVITVSPPIADELAARFGIERPVVIMNAAEQRTSHPDAVDLRAVLPDKAARLVVHSGLLPHTGRNFMEMLEALARLPGDVHLAFLGDGPLREAIRQRSVRLGVEGRVHFVPPVPAEAVVPSVSNADLALVLIDHRHGLSKTHSLPNKLFEAMAAGVPVVASDLPLIAAMVREFDCGVLCDSSDPHSIVSAIREALNTKRFLTLKENARRAALLVTWASEEAKLLEIYRCLGGL